VDVAMDVRDGHSRTPCLTDLKQTNHTVKEYRSLLRQALTITRRLLDLSHILPAEKIVKEAEGKLAEISALMDTLRGMKASKCLARLPCHG
jgi:hypothetical protein